MKASDAVGISVTDSAKSYESFWEKLLVYVLLIAGAVLFCWPLLWMLSTSFKVDRELFASQRHFFPQAPLPRLKSPYVDDRYYEGLSGPKMDLLLPALGQRLDSMDYAWPHDLDRQALITAVARGLYEKFRNLIPVEQWRDPSTLLAAAVSRVDKPLVDDVVGQVRRCLVLGQLSVRSYDLQEEQLVAAKDAVKAWKLSGSAQAGLVDFNPRHDPQLESGAEIHYDFSKGDVLRLSQTFTTSFPISRLYHIQIGMRGDDTWHPMTVYIEKQGKLYRAAQVKPLADYTWVLYTYEEAGPDDRTNKIRTWTDLEEVGSSPTYESGPHKLKVIIEIRSISTPQAWLYKMERNYLLTFDNMPFLRYVATSVYLVILNLAGTLLSCSMVAFSFARLRWPGRKASFGLMLATMMIPGQVTMIPFFLIIRWLGWYNTLLPLWVCSFFANAFNVFLLHEFFKGVPTDLEDAAKIDGCGPVRTYWYIMMPLVKPALATVSIFTFMGVWNDFMGPLIFLNDQRLYPLSLGLYALKVQTGSSMSLMMAGSLLMILPVVLVFFFFQRYFIQGITMTGMKG